MDAYRIRELIEFADQRSRDYSLPNADIAAYRDTAAALRELMQRSNPPVVQQGGLPNEKSNHLRVVAKQNLHALIVLGSDDTKLMLSCLEELS